MNLQEWISEERFKDYLLEADGDATKAVELYRWNASMSAALFELVHHFEVLLRNKIVDTLSKHPPAAPVLPGSPWLDLHDDITKISNRLKRKNQEITAGKIYSNLTLGSWVNMFIPDSNEELWRQTLRHVLPHGRIDRSIAASYLQSINELRNRIAHHASLLDLDPWVEYRKTIQVAEWIDSNAAEWIRSACEEKIRVLASERQKITPLKKEVMLVPARLAWPLYDEGKQHFYICPANWSNRQIKYISFYSTDSSAIQGVIPKVLNYTPAVNFNEKSAKSLEKSSDKLDKSLSKLIKAALHKFNFSTGTYQVYHLSSPSASETYRLSSSIPNLSLDGRRGAFRGKMYLSLGQLTSARSTENLLSGS